MSYNEEHVNESVEEVEKEVEKENKYIWEKRLTWILPLAIFIVTETILIFILCYNYRKQSEYISSTLPIEKSETTSDEFESTLKVLEEIDKYYKGTYVNDVNYEELTLKMANSLIASYGDKYGIYLNPKLAEESKDADSNKLLGIGVLIRAETVDDIDQLYVIDSFKGSGAEEVGIKEGCIITKINGEQLDFDKLSYNDVVDTIRGEAGTSVNISYINLNGEEITVDVERRQVTTETISFKVINSEIGYIKIRDFTANTSVEFKEVIEYFKTRHIEKIIFDLRDNTGGLLTTVTAMLDEVIPQKDVIYIVDKDEEIVETYSTDDKYYEFNSVCIINKDTASASELFVKSLQENGNTTVIGETSYGKGTVCSVIPLSDGGTLQISSFKYLTSSKECIEGIGVIPDIEMKLPENKEEISYKLSIDEDDIIVESIKLLSK